MPATRRNAPSGKPTIEQQGLLELMLKESDVKRVVRLDQIAPHRWRYLIETPFETFPKFVIGTTNAAFDDVRLEHRCGLLKTALEAWPNNSSEAQRPETNL